MNNEQIKGMIEVKKQMLGEFASRMNPLAGDDCPVNNKLCDLYEKCQAEIDRLEATLDVRATAKKMRAA